MLKTLDTVSNLIRAVVALVVVALASLAGWVGYRAYHADRHALQETEQELAASRQEVQDLEAQVTGLNDDVERLTADLAAARLENERLQTALALLKVDHRVAQIDVLDQHKPDPADATTWSTRLRFVEVGDEGRPLAPPRELTIAGDIVHVDAWVVKFDDRYVEQGDPLRGTSLCLFRRIYGEYQEPSEGFELDPYGSRPVAYEQGGEMNDLEREIWENFWVYATDARRRQASGVRAAEGEAKYTRLVPGVRYLLELRASGGLTIRTEDAPPDAPADETTPAG
jgi:outer membrane murein-binding lipoprotein Lpp